MDASGVECVAALRRLIGDRGEVRPAELIAACGADMADFRERAQSTDSVTMLVVGRLAS